VDDALTGLLREVRAEGALFGRSYLAPPWSVRFTDGPGLTMVVMLRRSGWVVPDDGPAVRLGEREVAVVTGAAPFSVADDPGGRTPPTYLVDGDGRCLTCDAAMFGEYLSSLMALRTRSRVLSRTFFSLLMTRDTVMADTPADRATSSIVTVPRLRRLGLFIKASRPAV